MRVPTSRACKSLQYFSKGWLQERSGEWSALTLLHRAHHRFLDFVREGSISSNPVADAHQILDKGSATIVRALAPEPERALASRQCHQFGSVLGDLMRNWAVALMR